MKIRSFFMLVGALIIITYLYEMRPRSVQDRGTMSSEGIQNIKGNKINISSPTRIPKSESRKLTPSQHTKPITLSESVREFSANQFNLRGLELNRQRVEVLAADNQAVEKAVQILLNKESTLQEFGSEQAAARVFAIRLLGERARQGDLKPLMRTAVDLGETISKLDIGQKADFRDLITEWIGALGAKDFYDDPSLIMRHFQNAAEVRKTIIAASIAHLGNEINNPEFMNRMRLWR